MHLITQFGSQDLCETLISIYGRSVMSSLCTKGAQVDVTETKCCRWVRASLFTAMSPAAVSPDTNQSRILLPVPMKHWWEDQIPSAAFKASQEVVGFSSIRPIILSLSHISTAQALFFIAGPVCSSVQRLSHKNLSTHKGSETVKLLLTIKSAHKTFFLIVEKSSAA